MDVKSINQQLGLAYQDYLSKIHAQTDGLLNNASSPLLMHVFDEYASVPKKIMFVGQETHSWAGLMNERKKLGDLIDTYRNFEMGNRWGWEGRKTRVLTSPFWNFNRSCFVRLNGLENDRRNKGFLWSNISKFDINGTTPSTDHIDAHPEGFDLLVQEINITKPDIIVFYAGDKYQDYLNRKLSLEESAWQQVGDDSTPLKTISCTIGDHPCRLFRTEHPRTLCQGHKYRGKGMYQLVLNKLVEAASTVTI